MDHTSNSLAQKGFRCFDPSSRFRRPGMLPSMSTSYSSPPLPLVGAYWISILWIFFTSGFSCVSRASGRVRVSRESGSQPSIEQPALAPRSSNNKEQPAALSSSSNDQLPTDSSSSSIAAEPSPSLRLNGSPGPDLEKELKVAGWLVDRCLASKEPDKN